MCVPCLNGICGGVSELSGIQVKTYDGSGMIEVKLVYPRLSSGDTINILEQGLHVTGSVHVLNCGVEDLTNCQFDPDNKFIHKLW